MSRSVHQEMAGEYLATLRAPTPWAPLNANGRDVLDATGRPVAFILPSGDPVRDHALAVVIAKAMNAAAGADPAAAEHMERPDPRAFGRRVSGVAGR